jgi:hypothetical protein
MSTPDPSRAEDCRYEVRHHLAARSTLALDADAIQRGLSRRYDYSRDEVVRALAFLVSLGHVAQSRSALGATFYYQITAAGTLADERGE